jgi:hypothetical protein
LEAAREQLTAAEAALFILQPTTRQLAEAQRQVAALQKQLSIGDQLLGKERTKHTDALHAIGKQVSGQLTSGAPYAVQCA